MKYRLKYIFILHSRTFWEVRPATKRGMQELLEYIKSRQRKKIYLRNKRRNERVGLRSPEGEG